VSFSADTTVSVTIGPGGGSNTGLVLDRTTLSFQVAPGSSASEQTIAVSAAGGERISFSASVTSGSWLSVTPTEGFTPAQLRVRATPPAGATGTLEGSIAIRGATSSITVRVTLTVAGQSGGIGGVRIEKILASKARPNNSSCAEPPESASFLPSDEYVYVWFLVSGAKAGDQPTLEWRRPDGGVHRTGRWNPVASDGRWCFYSSLKIAGEEPASVPGDWTIEVKWNGASLFLRGVRINRTVTLAKRMTTAALPQGSSCPEPEPASEFRVGKEAHVWFLVREAAAGDVAKAEWVRPDGTVHRTTRWNPLASGGTWCYRDTLRLNETPAGRWSVRVLWNDALLFTEPFTVNEPVTIENRLMTREVTSGSGCTVPGRQEVFQPDDPKAMVWFSAAGANEGDRPLARWYKPNGELYTTDTWDPVRSAGNWCFWAWIDIDGKDPATLPGRWKVKVFWNDLEVFELPFTIRAVSVSARVITKNPPAEGCQQPEPAGDILVTDERVSLWFLVRGAKQGGVARTEWTAPDGSVYRRSRFSPIERDGNWCFTSNTPLAGTAAAGLPGEWTVAVFWDDIPLFEVTFTLLGSAGSETDNRAQVQATTTSEVSVAVTPEAEVETLSPKSTGSQETGPRDVCVRCDTSGTGVERR
jgi:hypothetical protein